MNSELMKKVSDLKILVVGDIMLDKYVVGDVERISPEAPVPIVDVREEYCTLGGCGNVAKNVANVGAQTYCVAGCGRDAEKDTLISIMRKNNIVPLMCTDRRPTTIKERIISGDRKIQLLRIDREVTYKFQPEKIMSEIKHLFQVLKVLPDIILISDYNKGVITKPVMEDIESYIDLKSGIKDIKLIIDPKPENRYAYGKAFAITPNDKEYLQMSLEAWNIENVIVTHGKNGVFIPKSSRFGGGITIDGNEVEVYNVTGAGDSFVSIFSICIGLGLNVIEASKISNICAAHVVTKPGTSSVPQIIFESAFNQIVKGD